MPGPDENKIKYQALVSNFVLSSMAVSLQVILAGTLTGVQGDIRCKVLAVFSTVKYLSWDWPNIRL